MRYRVALIEDDELLQRTIQFALEQAGYEVESFSRAEDFSGNQAKRPYDIIILDILLPGASGTELLRRLRAQKDNTPILMISVKSDIPTRVITLNSGADDYLAKPFNLEELLARLQALLRRSQGPRSLPSSNIIFINNYEVNMTTHQAQSRFGQVRLSEKEIRLLSFFIQHPKQTLCRVDILEEVWGMNVAPTPRTVDNFILKFRRLFETDPAHPRLFITVRGEGYRFEASK